MISPGTRLLLRYAGGGGYGPPAARDPAAVAADLRDGVITHADAYGKA
jgi:N-methylhydantoinase B/oxoprolinase/acetone carboxylase alpha subunit